MTKFGAVPNDACFEYGGTLFYKRSGRSAEVAERSGRWFYFGEDEEVEDDCRFWRAINKFK